MEHVITAGDVLKFFLVMTGFGLGLAAIGTLLVLMTKGWDH